MKNPFPNINEKGPTDTFSTSIFGLRPHLPRLCQSFDRLDLAPDTRQNLMSTGRLLWLQRACPSTTLDKDAMLCRRNFSENPPDCQTVYRCANPWQGQFPAQAHLTARPGTWSNSVSWPQATLKRAIF